MENILFLFLLITVSFSLLALSYRLFGLIGVYIFVIVSVIAANIQVNKFVHYLSIGDFTIDATLGNVMFGSVFLATDFINERYGKQKAHQIVKLSIFANLAFVAVMIVAGGFAPFNADEFATSFNQSFDTLFAVNGNVVKAVIIGNCVYFLSQSLDIRIYKWLHNKWPSQMALMVRNNVSTLCSQLFDTFLVTWLFALAGIFPMEFVGSVIASTLAVKLIISLLDTPFLYLMTMMKSKPIVSDSSELKPA